MKFKLSYFARDTDSHNMILYNITFNIEPEIKDDWLDWMQKYYFPFVMETKLFFEYKIFRLLTEKENDGLTYSVQFFTDNLEKVNIYLENYAPKIVETQNITFKYKHVSFMSILESVE